MTPLTDEELSGLLGFLGYGNPDGPVWFLGMEEGGGGEDNLRRRLQFHRVEDLAEAHAKLGIHEHHSRRRVIQPTWRGMSAVMLLTMGLEPSREAIRRYQAEQLGRRGNDTFLLEMMPLPKPNMGHWGYAELLPQFDSREDYYARIMPHRVAYLREFLIQRRPHVVVAYGKTYWHHYRSLFADVSFTSVGHFAVCQGRPLVLLCDHFTSRPMNTGVRQVADILRPVLYKAASA